MNDRGLTPVVRLAPAKLNVGDTVISANSADIKVGNSLPLRFIPVGTEIHAVELKPGGLHLMLMQPKDSLKPGDAVEVVLELEDGQTSAVELEVRAPTGR